MKKTATAKVVGKIASPAAATNRASDKFILRLPEGMREYLAKVAESERRSMNSVALDALEMYFADKHGSEMYFADKHGSRVSKGRREAIRQYRLSAGIETAIGDLVEQVLTHHPELLGRLIKKVPMSPAQADIEAAREAIEADIGAARETAREADIRAAREAIEAVVTPSPRRAPK